ncbi:ICOS ligand [Choloepus didactylus]|uniref:ICOS ligand n=1 Tax=Choloepus didactylus TaxID=27675 RepID=UPI0018A0C343|nr:ICOS ligand [Choloepus didactylus]
MAAAGPRVSPASGAHLAAGSAGAADRIGPGRAGRPPVPGIPPGGGAGRGARHPAGRADRQTDSRAWVRRRGLCEGKEPPPPGPETHGAAAAWPHPPPAWSNPSRAPSRRKPLPGPGEFLEGGRAKKARHHWVILEACLQEGARSEAGRGQRLPGWRRLEPATSSEGFELGPGQWGSETGGTQREVPGWASGRVDGCRAIVFTPGLAGPPSPSGLPVPGRVGVVLARLQRAPRPPGEAGWAHQPSEPAPAAAHLPSCLSFSSLGLLVLLLAGLLAEILQETEVRGIVGSHVELPCVYPEGNSFDLNDLYVYWQIGKTVVTYSISGESSQALEAESYRGRTQLSLDSMKQGNFSLRLYNVTPHDEQKFSCLVFRKSLELRKVLDVTVMLHVAANYSMPVVSASSSPSPDELTFMCTATDGYPRPNVHWINETDGSLLDAALQNSSVVRNARGLYDVLSVLRLRRVPRVNVRCCIENVLLSQNLTVSSETELFNGTKDRITENPDRPHQDRHTAVFSITAVLAVAAVFTAWFCHSRCPRGCHTGAPGARPVLELTEHAGPDVLLGPSRAPESCHQEGHQTALTNRTSATRAASVL